MPLAGGSTRRGAGPLVRCATLFCTCRQTLGALGYCRSGSPRCGQPRPRPLPGESEPGRTGVGFRVPGRKAVHPLRPLRPKLWTTAKQRWCCQSPTACELTVSDALQSFRRSGARDATGRYQGTADAASAAAATRVLLEAEQPVRRRTSSKADRMSADIRLVRSLPTQTGHSPTKIDSRKAVWSARPLAIGSTGAAGYDIGQARGH